MKRAIYPGSFDPITYGHMDIINRALQLFDSLVIGIGIHIEKKPLFTTDERLEMIKSLYKNEPKIKVVSFETLLVDFAKSVDAQFIVRGLRAVSDFEYEFQMALANRKMYPELESVFLMPSEKYIYLNSSLVKTISSFDGKFECFVPPLVSQNLRDKFNLKKK